MNWLRAEHYQCCCLRACETFQNFYTYCYCYYYYNGSLHFL